MNGHFGQYLRAARLGYRKSKRLGAFVRISDEPNGTFRIDLVPTDGRSKFPEDRASHLHRCWWEGDAETFEEALATAPAISALRIDKTLTVYVNDDGEVA